MKVTNFKSWGFIFGFALSSVFAQTFRDVRPESVGLSSKRLERLTNELDDYDKLRTLIYQSIID